MRTLIVSSRPIANKNQSLAFVTLLASCVQMAYVCLLPELELLLQGWIQWDTFSTESSKGEVSVSLRANSELSTPALHERFKECLLLGRMAVLPCCRVRLQLSAFNQRLNRPPWCILATGHFSHSTVVAGDRTVHDASSNTVAPTPENHASWPGVGDTELSTCTMGGSLVSSDIKPM